MSKKSSPKPRKATTTKSTKVPGTLVWFDIPDDNMERAKKFYSSLFGWKIEPFSAMPDYWHIDTAGADETPNGGLLPRKHPGHPVTNYISVAAIDKAMAKVEKLGRKICMPKTAVPQMGYFAICLDTENNTFALWERNETAK